MKLFKLFPVLLCAAVLCSCTTSNNSKSSEETTENKDINGEHYYLEYDNTVIDKDCALAVEKYFYAIESKDFDLYKESIYPEYYEKMNAMLEEKYSYDFKEVFNELYDKLLQSAASYLPTDKTEKSDASFKITEIEFSKGQSDDLDANIDLYKDIFGDEFYNNLKNNAENLYDVYFSIVAEVNGDSEQYILTDNEILVIKEKDGYYVFG